MSKNPREVEEKVLGNQTKNLENEGEKLIVKDRLQNEGKLIEMQNYDSVKSASPQTHDVELVWKNIKVVSEGMTKGCIKKTKIEPKTILNGVNGIVRGGECLAILGSTGAGKTTLLNFLSKKIESKNLKITGDILLNNKNIDENNFHLISSYVMQDDVLEPLMTPTEILLFTAKLRLTLPREEIEKRVMKMLNLLNLMRCKDTRIGDTITRGVSGGERKRTSIAVELITEPKIIFLDEPTTGLDSYNAYEVVSLLKSLAKLGKMVIFTIHQPSSEIFPLLDKICVLGLGKTIYFGPGSKCLEAFDYMGVPVPNKENPFQHFMEITNVTYVRNEKLLSVYPELGEIENNQEKYEKYISILSDKYHKRYDDYMDKSERIDGFSKEMKDHIEQRGVKNGFFYEFAMLFGRNTLVTMRNPKSFTFKIVQYIFSAIIFAIIFVKLTREFSGIQDRLGLIILSAISFVLNASTNQVLVFFSEKKVFLRERANKLYSVLSYYVAKFINDLPIYFFSASCFTLIVYYSAFLNDLYSYKFFVFSKIILYKLIVGILFLSSFGGMSYAYFISSFVNHQEALVTINTAFCIPLLILSGFFTSAENFAPYLIPLKYISFFKYSYQLLIHNEFSDIQPFYCFDSDPDICAPLANRFTFFEPYYVSFIAIVAVIILFNIISFFIVYKLAKIKV